MEQQLSKLVKEVAENKRLIKELSDDNKQTAELLHGIYQLVVEVSKKQDEWLNVGLKKPKKTTKNNSLDVDDPINEESDSNVNETSKDSKKNKKSVELVNSKNKEKNVKTKSNTGQRKNSENIMAYFKKKCREDIHFFDNILDMINSNELFEQNKEKIEAKKTELQKLTEKINILYKSLNDNQKEKLRKLLSTEKTKSIEVIDNIEPVTED